MYFSVFLWNPDRNFFVIPYLNHPVTWYGVLFATGFLLGYFLIRKIFATFLATPQKTPAETSLEAVQLTDRLAFLVVIGTVLGARLGHVFFYGWPYYKAHPGDIIKVWEGGLASHGGAVGILVALLLFVWLNRRHTPPLTFLTVLDVLVIPAPLVGGMIRVGNFINQEILGTPTDLPWAVAFMQPMEGPAGVPVHPAQLYEALFYFCVFGLLFFLWKQFKELGKGLLSGWYFVLVFGFRFGIEYLKMPQNETFDLQGLHMGQVLSIPFIVLGLFLLFRYYARKTP